MGVMPWTRKLRVPTALKDGSRLMSDARKLIMSPSGSDRPGDAEARPAFRPSLRLSRPPRFSDQMPLERRPRPVPVLETIGAGPVPVAVAGRRNGNDLDGAAFLSVVGHRLANATGDMASGRGRIGEENRPENAKR